MKPLLKPTIEPYGPAVEHNMPCAVCPGEPAVFQGNSGVFMPSWRAQKDGWMIVRVPKWLKRFLKRFEPGRVNMVAKAHPIVVDEPNPDDARIVKALLEHRDAWRYADETRPVDAYPRPMVAMLDAVERELNRLREKAGEPVQEDV